jgi:hypothetical protein
MAPAQSPAGEKRFSAFTGGSKIAEHGGLNEDDVHAA